MSGADLVFRIFAKDNGASRAFKQLGKAADDASDRIMGMRKSTLALAAVQAAPLAAPMVTSMLALSGLVAEGAAGMAVMKVATVGMGDAFKAVGAKDMVALDEALRKLPPQAAGFVREAQHIAPLLKDIRYATQRSLFQPMELSLNRLANSYVPMLRKQLPALAHDIGLAGANFTQWAVTAPVLGSVQRIIAHTGGDMQILARVAQNATEAFLGLASTALPFTTHMLTALERGTVGWRNWVAAAKQSGRLESIFGKTSETMDQLGHTVTLLTTIIGDLFANPNTVQAANNLISVLNLALKVVGGLTRAFSHLPDGVQVAVLSMAGMYLVLRQVSSAFTLLTLVGARAVGGLTVGMVGLSRAVAAGHIAKSMVGMASSVGVAVGAVAGLGYGLYLLNENAAKPTEHSVSKLSASLLELGRTAKITGEATRVIGSNMSVLFGLMSKIEKTAAGYKSQNSLAKAISDSVGGPDNANAKAANQLKQNFKEIDQALTDLVQSGQINEAQGAFSNLRETWAASGRSLSDLNSKLPEFAAAQQASALAALGAGKGFGIASEKARVMAGGLAAAVTEGRKLTDVFTLLNGGIIAFDHAQLAASESSLSAMEAFKQNGRALEGDSIAAQRNRVSVQDAASAWVAAAQAKYEQTGSVEDAQAVWVKDRDGLIASARAAGFSKTQIDALTAAIGQMPTLKAPKIAVPGATAATGQVSALDAEIKALKGKLAKIDIVGPVAANTEIGRLREQIRLLESKRISITTDFRYTGNRVAGVTGRGGAFAASGGLIRKFAGGGFNGHVRGPGTGTSDSVPAMLSNGEYVIKASSVKTVGVGAMEALNKTGRMPAGGGGSPVFNEIHVHMAPGSDGADVVRKLQSWCQQNGALRLKGGVTTIR